MTRVSSLFNQSGIRRLVLLLLSALLMPVASQAEELYRWIEKDGSVTFSPTPPPTGSGIEYEQVVLDESAISAENAPEAGLPAATGAIAVPSGSTISESSSTPAVGVPGAPTDTAVPQGAPDPKSNKSAQCQELLKRVVSLERLVSTGVSAETMDNAYVQMARYQASYDQHCKL